MTNREKIAMLKELKKEVNELCIDNPLEEYEEDMNRGIERSADLIQEKINTLYKELNKSEKPTSSTTKNDLEVDAISRQEVLNTIRDWWKIVIRADGEPGLCNRIRSLSSVTPIRPKGHWTDDGYCSCCNQQTLPLDVSGYASGYDSFCSNCGADMREEEND